MTVSLNTARLILSPLPNASREHVAWLNDPETVRFSEQRHVKHTAASVQKYVLSFDGEDSHIWGIYVADSGDHIGNVTAHIDRPNNVAEMGILLGEHRGQGYGAEAWRAVADWLLAKDGGAVRKAECGMMAPNTAMRKIAERTGFAFEGERRLHFLWNGQPVGMLMFGRFP